MINYALFILHAVIFATVFFVAPVMASFGQPGWLYAVPLLALFTNQHWSLLHECIHGSFHANRRINNLAGKTLGIFFCASFGLVRPSHLLHHQVNRTDIEQLEICKGTLSIGKQAGYYFGLFCGLFLSEFLGTMLMVLPRQWLERIQARFFAGEGFAPRVFAMIMNKKGGVEAARKDAWIILVILVVSFWLYADHWWVLALFLAIRMVMVSFLDYVYHYGTPLGDPLHGYNLQLPVLASKFLLHFNLHGVHHKNPGIPWHQLPALFKQQALGYDGRYFHQALRQLNGLKKAG